MSAGDGTGRPIRKIVPPSELVEAERFLRKRLAEVAREFDARSILGRAERVSLTETAKAIERALRSGVISERDAINLHRAAAALHDAGHDRRAARGWGRGWGMRRSQHDAPLAADVPGHPSAPARTVPLERTGRETIGRTLESSREVRALLHAGCPISRGSSGVVTRFSPEGYRCAACGELWRGLHVIECADLGAIGLRWGNVPELRFAIGLGENSRQEALAWPGPEPEIPGYSEPICPRNPRLPIYRPGR